MHERLQYLIKDSGLSSSRFAEMVGIQPSAVSHLISGRNKPGFDILAKILTKFPDLNPRWLILGEQPVYLDNSSKISDITQPIMFEPKQAEDQGNKSRYGILPDIHTTLPEIQEISAQEPINNVLSSNHTGPISDKTDKETVPGDKNLKSEIDKIVIFYSDGTFDSFKGR